MFTDINISRMFTTNPQLIPYLHTHFRTTFDDVVVVWPFSTWVSDASPTRYLYMCSCISLHMP